MGFYHSGSYYLSKVMVFGLTGAPFWFHKTTRPMVRYLRMLAIRILSYLDDFLWGAAKGDIKELVRFAKQFFTILGFRTNEKCEWEGSFTVIFLGIMANTEEMRWEVPAYKRCYLVTAMTRLKEKMTRGEPLGVKEVRIVSLRLALEPAQAWTRALYGCINTAVNQGWNYLLLTAEAKEELKFWPEWLKNPAKCTKAMLDHQEDMWMKLDTGEYASGGHLSGRWVTIPLPGQYIGTSSTRRELYGLVEMIAYFARDIQGKKVRFDMDSLPGIRNLIKGGGPKSDLCQLVKRVWKQLNHLKVTPIWNWIPREKNKVADRLSKALATRAVVRPDILRLVREASPVPSVLIPSFNDIGASIDNLRMTKAAATVILPYWPSRTWWVVAQETGHVLMNLPTAEETLAPMWQHHPISIHRPKWRMLAMTFDFTM